MDPSLASPPTSPAPDTDQLMLEHLDRHGPFYVRRLRQRYGDHAVDRALRKLWIRAARIAGGDAAHITHHGLEALHGTPHPRRHTPSPERLLKLTSFAAVSYDYVEHQRYELLNHEVPEKIYRKGPDGLYYLRAPGASPGAQTLTVIAQPFGATLKRIRGLIDTAYSIDVLTLQHVYVPNPIALRRLREWYPTDQVLLLDLFTIPDALPVARATRIRHLDTARRPTARRATPAPPGR